MKYAIARSYSLVGICALAVISSSALLAQQPDKECQCRAPGGDMRDLGTVECIDIAGKKKLVFCTMSTNTPYWKDVDAEGCPSA